MSYPSRRGAGAPGVNGADGKQVELHEGSGYVQWRYVGETTWRNLMPLSDISGADGRSVNLRVNSGWIQWQHSGDSAWQNLMSMDDMRGSDGKDGENGSDGADGLPNQMSVGSVTSSSHGTAPQVTITGESPSQVINFSLPQPRDGANGTNASLQVGTVTSLPAGSKPTVQITGTAPTQTINFGIPLPINGTNGTNGTNGANYTPQTMVSRAVTVATPYQHTDLTKPFKVMLNARSNQTVTVAGLVNDRVELRVGPSTAAVAPGGSGGFSVGVWESGITGIALMVGAAVLDGGQVTADVPAGWYFQVNRLSGTNATIVSCFTQSMS